MDKLLRLEKWIKDRKNHNDEINWHREDQYEFDSALDEVLKRIEEIKKEPETEWMTGNKEYDSLDPFYKLMFDQKNKIQMLEYEVLKIKQHLGVTYD